MKDVQTLHLGLVRDTFPPAFAGGLIEGAATQTIALRAGGNFPQHLLGASLKGLYSRGVQIEAPDFPQHLLGASLKA